MHEDHPPPKSKVTASQAILWVLVALLVVGLSGFGLTNFGSADRRIGSVGNHDISADEYIRAINNALQSMSRFGLDIGFSEALEIGLDKQVLQNLVSQAALDSEISRLGLSASNALVAQQIRKIVAFQDVTGKFDKEAYRFALEHAGLTAADFEEQIRQDIAHNIYLASISFDQSTDIPPAIEKRLYDWHKSVRSFSALVLDASYVSPQPNNVSDQVLRSYYNENIESFTSDERYQIVYTALLPDPFSPEIGITEDDIRAIYEERIDEFKAPETRFVERLVYPDDATAEAAKQHFDQGKSFDDLILERGLSFELVNLGQVQKGDLGEAGKQIFTLTEPGVIGPLQTDLGPAIFRVTAIIEKRNFDFDEVKDTLRGDAKSAIESRLSQERTRTLTDKVDMGKRVEEIAEELGQEAISIVMGPLTPNDDIVSADPTFRETIHRMRPDGIPEVVTLQNGGAAVVRVDALTPPTPILYTDARGDVLAAWMADDEHRKLVKKALEIKGEVARGRDLSDIGEVKSFTGVTRKNTHPLISPKEPQTLVETIFSVNEGDLQVIESPGFVALVRLDSARLDAEQSHEEYQNYVTQLQGLASQDFSTLLSNGLANDAGVSLNQPVIKLINTQF